MPDSLTHMLQRINLTHFVLLGIFFFAGSRTTIDADTWWHLAAGRWMVQHGQFLTIDVFSHTRFGMPWHFPGWIVEVGMYLLYRVAGLGGLNIWTGVMCAGAYWFVAKTIPDGRDTLRALAVLGGAAAGMVHAVARPALVTLLCMAVYLWVLENDRRRLGRRLWLLPLLMVVWVNSHPMFVLAFGLVGLYAAGELWEMFACKQSIAATFRRYALLLLALLSASAVNPYGFEILLYPVQAVAAQREAMQHILEWQSPDFHQIEFLPFALMLIAVVITRRAEKTPLVGLGLLSGFAFAALYSLRNIALFGVVAPVGLFAGYSAKAASPAKPVRSVIILAVLTLYLGIGGALVACRFPMEVNLRKLEQERLLPSAGAIAYLREHQPAGPLFNSYNWGGYLLWALPEYPVFVDGRADLYGDAIIEERWYRVVMVQQGWEKALDGTNLVLLERDWPVVNALALAGWTKLYIDDQAVIFTRAE